ncbi:unnamed protein product [Eruca vesicaria subsp. sativa]|uniref:Uncharacterized protein n=1 Tax=Eruca vesicaria subsp. sativa TaxID=29727 RepID=A0ABC8KJE3_ERUVS|nr:unnamed protein product [Eruca vesicaria subsp. sativa]
MATLQRFKFLATQCGVEQSPTRSPSPSTSPLVQFRRKKTTLKMLLSLGSPSRREQTLIHHEASHRDVGGRKLRDLFVSSSPLEEEEEEEEERPKGKTKEEVLAAMRAKLNASAGSQMESAVWFGFSKRLLKRAWRPKLGTITE